MSDDPGISDSGKIHVLSHPHGIASIQERPGRLGYWDVGIPPSGPMDSSSFIAANRLVDNPDDTAAIELAECGLRLRFTCSGTIATAGAEMELKLNQAVVPFYTKLTVQKGDVLQFGQLKGRGFRAYLAVRGGIDAPQCMGSRSTFVRGKIGSVLAKGDCLQIGSLPAHHEPYVYAPAFSKEWELEVRVGPHALEEYIEPHELMKLIQATWTVSNQLDRTGIRLQGPKPKWARKTGGNAGLNPSNIMDTPYSVGAMNFMGDIPVLTGVDGPSLGGFCCLFCVESHDLWKLGQLAPGDSVRFRPLSTRSVIGRLHAGNYVVRYLQSGDHGILVEYGPEELCLELRMRVFMLHEALRKDPVDRMTQLSPGVRGLLVEFELESGSMGHMVERLKEVERSLAGRPYPPIPARTVRLPLSWEDPQVVYAVKRYMQSLDIDAEWCPDNIEFVRKLNGFETKEALREFFFETEFLVLGLGDVYMGAPLAMAVDPEKRLRSTKYNPARTWTPEGAVGLGGHYLCIYGMESPGGYQLIGRTLPTWRMDAGHAGNLFHWFDRISFYPVTPQELDDIIEQFRLKQPGLETEPTLFDWNTLREVR